MTRQKIKASNHTKERLIDFLCHFGEIYKKTRSFSLSAGKKIEELNACLMTEKDTIIALQGDVIAAKNEQLAHVRTAVKEEISSVQSVVQ